MSMEKEIEKYGVWIKSGPVKVTAADTEEPLDLEEIPDEVIQEFEEADEESGEFILDDILADIDLDDQTSPPGSNPK